MLCEKSYEEWDDKLILNGIKQLCLSGSKGIKPLKKIENIPSLETIDLSHVHPIVLIYIGKRVKDLKQLTRLDIGNGIETSYPPMLHIHDFPVSLTYLDMSNINFENFGFGNFIQKLKNLDTLILSHTRIRCIPLCPPSLRVLDISSNKIVHALIILDTDEQIKPIMNLETLVIHGNKNIKFSKRIPLHILQF